MALFNWYICQLMPQLVKYFESIYVYILYVEVKNSYLRPYIYICVCVLGRCMQKCKLCLHWCPLEKLISCDIASRMRRRGHGQLLISQLIASITTSSLPFPDTTDAPLAVLFKICPMATQGSLRSSFFQLLFINSLYINCLYIYLYMCR